MAISAAVISSAIFLAMIINLAAKPKFANSILSACLFCSSIGGLVIYSIAYSSIYSNIFVIVARTLLTVCRMFAGVNEYNAIVNTPVMSFTIVLFLFWLCHLMAFYATASAAISTIGAAALKRLRYYLQRYGSSVVIFGINDDSVRFGQSLVSTGINKIVYVDSKPDTACENAINTLGCIINSSASALVPDEKFLKFLGSEKGSPDLTLYTLDSEVGKNIAYAKSLLGALESCGVNTENVHLIIRSSDDSVECGLQGSETVYGYADVKIFTDVSLTGRMLMKHMPPCDKMTFNEDGTAAEDFDAVIIGFGRTGRSILRYLTRNAQFEGCHYRAGVFSPAIVKENGHFLSSYPDFISNYDISFYDYNAKSVEFFNYIKEHASTLKYVVICTGSSALDDEIRSDISSYLNLLNCSPAICKCSKDSIAWSVTPDAPISYCNVYSADAIGSKTLDKLAMMLNYSYLNDNSITAEKAWINCDYFSRESSRAAVDFLSAYEKITGRDEEDLLLNGWGELSDSVLENLGKTEHLRWCAFHYSMGFSPMTDEEIEKRGQMRNKEIEENGKSSIRLSKDLHTRRHGCLRSWETLDNLSDLEQKYTGKWVDYKDMDIRNVLLLPTILRNSKGN